MALLTKDQIADILESIAQMLELKGENIFKIRAYTNAARALETYAGDLTTAAAENRLGDIHGIGRAIADKVTELVTTGQLAYYETLRAEFPTGIFEMFELQGLGPKKIKALWEKLNVTTVAELEAACKDGRAAALPGFGKKTADNILAAIQSRAKHAGRFRLGEIAPDAENLLAELRDLPDVLQAAIAGSYRRRKEIVGDLDFIVATNAPAEVSAFFVQHPMVESVMAHGATKSSVRLKIGIQADLRVVKNPEYPFALNYFTGSKEHNIIMRQRALARGWTLNEYRLGRDETPKVEPQPVPPILEERDLYRALGLDYVEPELREDRGEFLAAENHTLPTLVETANLRGTFHNHTVASDGRSTLAEMAAAAQELGLQYLGIADHSKASFQAHGLDAAQLLLQVAEIRELNKTFDGHFKLFAGSEVDVLKDGSLDFPDEVLAQLDYCVVSIHNVFNLPEAEMTKRIIKAIENPYVTILGHLTGRLLLTRDGYAVDHAAVIEAAAATGTIIELNANPRRLDMDWRWWPLAKAKGVKCAINPDAHHTSQLQFLHFGVGTARKGWLTRNDVVNTLPLKEIEVALRRQTLASLTMWLVVALIVIVSYLLGSIPSGLLISRSQGIDIREHGSRNIGATNVWRTMGRKWGILAFLCDTCKGWLAVMAGFWLAAHWSYEVPLARGKVGMAYLERDFAGIAAALGCILGHNFPIWLRFKGGKGVATSLGVIIGMMPLVSLIIFAVWGLVLKLTRYVSLASIVAAISLPVAVVALLFFGPSGGWAAVKGWGNFHFAVAACLLVIKRHVPNIKRLFAGTELRFGEPKPSPEESVPETPLPPPLP